MPPQDNPFSACLGRRRAGAARRWAIWYNCLMTREQIDLVLENVRSWPPQDQEELAEVAREIEARRSGVYVMTDEERAAIAQARESQVVSNDEVAEFWKSRGIS